MPTADSSSACTTQFLLPALREALTQAARRRPRAAQAVGAVERPPLGIEDVDAQDQVVGLAFALQHRRQRGEVGKLQAQRQRRLDAVLDGLAGEGQPLFDDAAGRGLVFEVVQQPGHADREGAYRHGDTDHPALGRIHVDFSSAAPLAPALRAELAGSGVSA
ncbi:MAG: hypothetical protein IPM99_26140 [Rubrivivax sp.]|nr:hypothetical protein [Rubrivivax sp.]